MFVNEQNGPVETGITDARRVVAQSCSRDISQTVLQTLAIKRKATEPAGSIAPFTFPHIGFTP